MSDSEEHDSENEENFVEDEYSGLKNIAIILIDIGPGMFDDKKLIKLCLSSVYEQMYRMLLRAHKRNISVCFVRDDEIIFTALNDNLVDSCKKILELLKQSINELKTTYERSTTPSLRYTFSECLKQIKNLGKINPYIVLLTNDDDPHKGDVQENLAAIDVALFFKESNVKLVVLPMKENFDYKLFYGELLKNANDVNLDFLNDRQVYNNVEDINEILCSIIQSKSHVRRYYFRLFNKEDIDVGFWSQARYLVKEDILNTNINISRETKNPVKLENENQNSIDYDKFILQTPVFLKSETVITKADFHKMKVKMPLGFQLLYLSDKKKTSMHYLHRRSIILQADETQKNVEYPKKLNLFNDLWHYAKQSKKYIICAYQSIGSRTHPQFIEFYADVFQNKPCLIGQIFVNCEEMGDYPKEEEASEEFESIDRKIIPHNDRELLKVCEMIDKLKVKKFSPDMFPCYEYEVKSALIKAQLLDTEVQDVDDSFPSNENVTTRLGELNDQLKDIFTVVETPKIKRPRKK